MKPLLLIIFISVVFIQNSSAAIFHAGTAEWRPFAYTSKKGDITGISADIITEIARRTGHTIYVKLYPAKRLNIMFDKNKLDMNFADSPIWNEEKDNPNYIFTISYMNIKEYLYVLNNDPKIMNVSNLSGKSIGIVLGYYYPLFEQAFKTKQIRKQEFIDETFLLKMLKRKRVDAVVMDHMLFGYLLKNKGYLKKDFRREFQVSDAPVGIKMRIEKKEFVQDFNKALTDMINEKFIETIIQKYTE